VRHPEVFWLPNEVSSVCGVVSPVPLPRTTDFKTNPLSEGSVSHPGDENPVAQTALSAVCCPLVSDMLKSR
jgi:hypothetical protein